MIPHLAVHGCGPRNAESTTTCADANPKLSPFAHPGSCRYKPSSSPMPQAKAPGVWLPCLDRRAQTPEYDFSTPRLPPQKPSPKCQVRIEKSKRKAKLSTRKTNVQGKDKETICPMGTQLHRIDGTPSPEGSFLKKVRVVFCVRHLGNTSRQGSVRLHEHGQAPWGATAVPWVRCSGQDQDTGRAVQTRLHWQRRVRGIGRGQPPRTL